MKFSLGMVILGGFVTGIVLGAVMSHTTVSQRWTDECIPSAVMKPPFRLLSYEGEYVLSSLHAERRVWMAVCYVDDSGDTRVAKVSINEP